ncbi:MAG TPA: hypothetical protein DCS97_00155 [Planctomycetes bacterium]|nr:hypothetical protein [Planctomycetota bacterium]
MRLLLPTAFVLASCAAPSGDSAVDSALSDAAWLELDLTNRSLHPVTAPDARGLTETSLRRTRILFRCIPAGTTNGHPAVLPGGGEPEDSVPLVNAAPAYLAVFELTRGQWARLQGQAEPNDPALPVTGLAPAEVAEVTAAFRLPRFRLALPDAGLWARGCDAGSAGLFTWGDSTDPAVSTTYAVLCTASNPPSGPAPVGGLLPNAFGLFDMHGNVWEAVRSGTGYAARGGAWDAAPLQARTANQVPVDGEVQHPSLGVRLALMP